MGLGFQATAWCFLSCVLWRLYPEARLQRQMCQKFDHRAAFLPLSVFGESAKGKARPELKQLLAIQRFWPGYFPLHLSICLLRSHSEEDS